MEKAIGYRRKSGHEPNNISAGDPISRREVEKDDRRQRTIKAAQDLIREHDGEGLYMRLLAERSGVGLATPYNLFGSKNVILRSVLGDVREHQEQFIKSRPAGPIERIFAAIEHVIEFYSKDAKFCRPVWAVIFDVASDPRRDGLSRRWNGFRLALYGEAIAAGAIDKSINADVLLRQFALVLRSAMFE